MFLKKYFFCQIYDSTGNLESGTTYRRHHICVMHSLISRVRLGTAQNQIVISLPRKDKIVKLGHHG